MIEVVGVALMLFGSIVMLLAVVGIIKFDDIFLRLHASSKSGSFGLLLMLAGVTLFFGDLSNAGKMAAVALLIFLKTPVASQAIVRAAYFIEDASLWHRLEKDEWRGKAAK